ncbi:hypothetical protein FIU89_16415 [Roseovarius sp. THAF27]|uniref:hypothetical protein n=1 Tax=unclassified Roseovarius TaxID=2614913 RepID=UPI001269366D|nr:MULTISPECIES: hypothetical protein [unclassified Roseovarius]QFT82212.1 hypothetical protein FIU89_16415 [Roseovarius sp. THAF27]QFT98757.1 hypothetical protein FIU85_15695 [Roseovarius sp. THAF8]
MDGQTIEQDARSAEYLRQREIFERSMAELQTERRRREASGYAVMAMAYSLEGATRKETRLGKVVTFATYALVTFVAVLPNLAMILMLAG